MTNGTTDPTPPPKAFISHATLDKPRIVRPLDEQLRARGVDIWLDERENLPGTNLVDQIFEHGLGQADIVIVVLSVNSIDRPWVHAELTTAVVRQIEGKVKALIPIILDGVTPPVSVERLVQERITNLAELSRHVERITATIFGFSPAPVAAAPRYISIAVHRLNGLTPDDERIFALACNQVLHPLNRHPAVSFEPLRAAATALDMPAEHIEESISALESKGYFSEVMYGLGEGAYAAKFSWWGFQRYLKTYRADDYRAARIKVIAALVNGAPLEADGQNLHELLIMHILKDLERDGHVMLGGAGLAVRVKPTLARVLRAIHEKASDLGG